MTRTERATFPRALIRDRSESKSGLDKSLRKGGGGTHNWGSIADEGYLEAAALEDEQESLSAEQDRRDSRAFITAIDCPVAHFSSAVEKHPSERRSNSLTEEDKRLARNFRKTALKGQGHPCSIDESLVFLTPLVDIDLSAIARTSAAVSTSPVSTSPTARIAVPMV